MQSSGRKCDCVHKGMDTVTESTEVNSPRKYCRRTQEEKRQIVEETLSSGCSVAEASRIHAVNVNQVFDRYVPLLAAGKTTCTSVLIAAANGVPRSTPLSVTAKLNGADPEAYLHHVIARIAEHPL